MSFPSSVSYFSGRNNNLGDYGNKLEQTTPPHSSLQGTNYLQVPFASITFHAEGQENSSRFFSRKIHYPGGEASGVTIGRGYDLGGRTPPQIRSDLLRSGVPAHDVAFFASAAGLKGDLAAAFVREKRQDSPEISQSAQYNLFTKILVPHYINDIKRIFRKDDVVEKYGEAEWENLPATVQSLLFDLRYRGDYSAETRKRLQPALVANDTAAFMEIIRDEDYWLNRGVPSGRVSARITASFEE